MIDGQCNECSYQVPPSDEDNPDTYHHHHHNLLTELKITQTYLVRGQCINLLVQS